MGSDHRVCPPRWTTLTTLTRVCPPRWTGCAHLGGPGGHTDHLHLLRVTPVLIIFISFIVLPMMVCNGRSQQCCLYYCYQQDLLQQHGPGVSPGFPAVVNPKIHGTGPARFSPIVSPPFERSSNMK